MSLNQSFAHTRVSKLNKTIDFEINESFSSSDMISNTHRPAGELTIGSNVISLSYSEIQEIIDTLQSVKDVIYKQHKLGMLPT